MPQELKTVYRQNMRFSGPLAQNTTYVDSGSGYGSPSFDPNPAFDVPISGIYETRTSVGHKGPPYNEGGPFSIKRYKFNVDVGTAVFPKTQLFPDSYGPGNQYTEYKGKTTVDPFIMGRGGVSVPSSYAELKSRHDAISFPTVDLSTYGAQGVAKFSPLNPGAGMGQWLAELRELPRLPQIMKKKLKFFKDLGSDYVNVEFGWKPFLKDLQNFFEVHRDLAKRMDQIVRDNGQSVRRKGLVMKSSESDYQQMPDNNLPIWPNPLYFNTTTPAPFKSARTTVSSQRIWFAGRFRYYLPWKASDEWPSTARHALYGTRSTPALLYQLMPWSWLIDWYSNLGSVLSNLSSNGIADLIIDYGYCMRHTKVESVATFCYSPEYTYYNGAGMGWVANAPYTTLKVSQLEETKERVAASPFGFGLQIDDLSDRQLAILIALGLSRQNFLSLT